MPRPQGKVAERKSGALRLVLALGARGLSALVNHGELVDVFGGPVGIADAVHHFVGELEAQRVEVVADHPIGVLGGTEVAVQFSRRSFALKPQSYGLLVVAQVQADVAGVAAFLDAMHEVDEDFLNGQLEPAGTQPVQLGQLEERRQPRIYHLHHAHVGRNFHLDQFEHAVVRSCGTKS